MYSVYIFLAFFYATRYFAHAGTLLVQKPIPPSISQAQGSSGHNASFSSMQALKSTHSSPSRPIPKRTLDLVETEIFPIPRSPLILGLQPRSAIQPDSLRAVLLTSDAFVARKISKPGPGADAPADSIWQYGTGDRPYTRLIVWSSMTQPLTWGQLKTIIDGLWILLIDLEKAQYTFFSIYDSKIDAEKQQNRLGWGAIVSTNNPPGNPLLGMPSLNSTENLTSTSSISTSKRAVQVSPADTLNVSHSV